MGGLGGVMLALEATGFQTHDEEPGGTTFVDAWNGFNDLSRLALLYTVHQHWL